MDQQRQRGDAGVGLVEVIVGMLIASLAMAALAQTLVTSVKSQRSDRLLAVGSALAIAELETVQALPWALVGHYDGDTGVLPDTVRLGTTRPAGSRAPLPTSTVVRDGTGYQVTRTVRWVDDPATGLAVDYKSLAVEVRWTSSQGPKRTRVDSIRTAQVGELAPSDFSLRLGTAIPADVALTSTGALTAALDLVVELTSPGNSATAEWVDRSGVLQTRTLSTTDGGRTFRSTLPSTTCCFRSAETAFVLRASRTSPASAVSGTASAALLQPLAVDAVSPSPASQCTPTSGSPAPVTVSITTTGTQNVDTVTVVASTGGSWPATHTGQSASGSTWTATVPGSAITSTTTLQATATRARPTTTTVTSPATAPLLAATPC